METLSYCQLMERYIALAAENEGLKEKMNKLATWPGIEFYSSAWEFNGGDGDTALEFMCDTKIPATDAFLAEITLTAPEQEPVYQVQYGEHWRDLDKTQFDDHVDLGAEGLRVLYTAGAGSVVLGSKFITPCFDTLALDTAREIMCDVNRRDELIGGDVQLLSRIQCRIDDACRAAMLQNGK